MIEIRNATAQDAAESARVHVEADWETYAPLFGAEEYMLDVAESECDGRRRWAMVERCSLRQMPVAIADRIDALYLLAAQSPEGHRQSVASTPPSGAARARYCRGKV